MAKGVNSPKMKLFDIVACLESDFAEFSHALDQSGTSGYSFVVHSAYP
jgi:hypothetical protein